MRHVVLVFLFSCAALSLIYAWTADSTKARQKAAAESLNHLIEAGTSNGAELPPKSGRD